MYVHVCDSACTYIIVITLYLYRRVYVLYNALDIIYV